MDKPILRRRTLFNQPRKMIGLKLNVEAVDHLMYFAEGQNLSLSAAAERIVMEYLGLKYEDLDPDYVEGSILRTMTMTTKGE